LLIALAGSLVGVQPSTALPTPDLPSPEASPGDTSDAPTEGTIGIGNVAHRGSSVTAPENSMPAVRQAIADRANFHGLDVHRTKDERLVVLHDRTLERTTNVEHIFPNRRPWRVSDFTWEELQRLDAGSWFHPAYTGERVPSLSQLTKRLADSPSGIFLEMKNPASSPGIGTQVVEVIRRNTDWLDSDGTDHRLVVQSFDNGFLREFHEAHPNIPVGALGGYAPSDLEWLDQVNVNHRALEPAQVDRAHRADVQVATFVVDDRDRMEAMIDMGVDAISTNRPGLLRSVLEERGRQMLRRQHEADGASQVGSAWSVRAPRRPLLATRVPVRAVFTDGRGEPVRWSWVTLQTRHSGAWHDTQRLATDRDGTVSTTLWLRRDVEVRWVPGADAPPGARPSAASKIDGRRASTVVRLGGREKSRHGARVPLTVRWRSENGREVSGRSTLWARPSGADSWRRIRTGRVSDGERTFRVHPRRTTRYQVRTARGWWWEGDRNNHRVVVPRKR
jgi:glycerophosphoryl diester phosphodiesterase